MVNYHNPGRWVIVQYRPGSGGKFLSAALMTIDKIAHWDPRVEYNQISYQDWVNEQWQHQQSDRWIAYEPLHKWDIRFFSRTWPRGENLSVEQYNDLLVNSSQYFKDVWHSGKLVLDFLNKAYVPEWWRDSCILRLDAKINCPIHRQLLLSKIYPFDSNTRIGTFMMDHPLPENPSPNARIYNNQYEFGPFVDQDAWYEYIWKEDFRLNFKMQDPTMLLNDLLDFETLERYIQQISTNLNSSYNSDNLKYVWNVWIRKHETILQSKLMI